MTYILTYFPKRYIRINALFATIFLTAFLILISLKGGDYLNYSQAYSGGYRVYTSFMDVLYDIFNSLSLNFDTFLSIIYLCCGIGIYATVKDNKNVFLFLIVSYYPLYILFLQGALRTGISIVISLLAITYFNKKRYKISAIYYLLSIYTHVASGFFFSLYIIKSLSHTVINFRRRDKVILYTLFSILVFTLYDSLGVYIEKYTQSDIDSADGTFFRLILHAPLILYIFFNKEGVKSKDLHIIKLIYYILLILFSMTLIEYINSTVLDRYSLISLILISYILSMGDFVRNILNILLCYVVFVVNFITLNAWFLLSTKAQSLWLL